MGQRLAVGLVIAVVGLAAGFGLGRVGRHSGSERAAATTTTTAVPTTTPAPSTTIASTSSTADNGNAPGCDGRQLDLAVTSAEPGAGNLLVGVTILDRGAPCWLAGFPSLTFFDAGGRELVVSELQHLGEPVDDHVILTTDTQRIASGHRFSGDATFVFSSGQHREAEDPPVTTVARMEVRLPGTTSSRPVDLTTLASDHPPIAVTSSVLVGAIGPSS